MNRRTQTDSGLGLLGEVIHAAEHAEAVVAVDSSTQWTSRRFAWVNALSAIAVTIFGLAICFGSRAYPMWVGAQPGPGFFPMIVGLCLSVLGVLYLISSLARRYHVYPDIEPPPDRNALWRSGVSLAIVAVAAFALVPIGYPIVAAACITSWLRLAGGRWHIAALTGVLFAAISFLLVTTVLGIQLPTGVLRPLLIGLL